MNIPEGFVLVPVEPTEEMLLAGYKTVHPDQLLVSAYKAMVAAAPAPQLPAYDEAKERQLFEDSMLLASEEAGYGEPDLYLLPDGSYRQEFHQAAWGGWKACAQSHDGSVSDE